MIVDLQDDPEVVAIVVTLGHSPRLAAAIESVLASESSLRLAVLCVVNAVTPIPGANRNPGVRYLTAGLNLGWSGGLALGRDHLAQLRLGFRYLWLIQDDMTVMPTTLDRLLAAVAEPQVAAASPIGVDEAGFVDRNGIGWHASDVLPTPWVPPTSPFRPHEVVIPPDMPYIPSRGMLVRQEAWDEVGGYDPRFYPAQWADVDFCHALSVAGWGLRQPMDAQIQHAGQGSTPRSLAEFLSLRNSQLFRAKWFGAGAGTSTVAEVGVGRAFLELTASGDPSARVVAAPELTRSVAVSAADAFLHLGRSFSAARVSWELQRDRLQDELADERRQVADLAELSSQAVAAASAAQDALAQAGALAQESLARAREAGELRGRQLAEVTQQRDGLAQQLAALVGSRSWRVTRPLRAIAARARGPLPEGPSSAHGPAVNEVP